MTSEGSCDTEDWSNDAENSALHLISTLTVSQSLKVYVYISNLEEVSPGL